MPTYIYFACPSCGGGIEIDIKEINCGIFRHGTFISNGSQLNPHAPKTECDALAEQKLLHGCGKPFQIIKKNGDWTIHICEYI